MSLVEQIPHSGVAGTLPALLNGIPINLRLQPGPGTLPGSCFLSITRLLLGFLWSSARLSVSVHSPVSVQAPYLSVSL